MSQIKASCLARGPEAEVAALDCPRPDGGRSRLVRCLAAFVVASQIGLTAAAAQAEGDSAPATSAPKAFLDSHCSSCHNDRLKRGNLSLASLDVDRAGDHPEVWEKVIKKLNARYMPPLDRPRPDEAAYDEFVARLESALDGAAAADPEPGRTASLHRLNRTEYRNAIRDLLALDVDVSAMLPKDEVSRGFDNVSVAGINPSLLERYLSTSQKISRLAIGSPVRNPGAVIVELPGDLTQEEHVEGLPFGTRGGAVTRHNFPRDGVYEIQLQLSRNVGGNAESNDLLPDPHLIELSLDGVQVEVFSLKPAKRGRSFDPAGKAVAAETAAAPPTGETGGKPAVKPGEGQADDNAAGKGLTARVRVTAGPHLVGAGFLKNPSALLEQERQPYHASFNPSRQPRPQPALYSFSIIGPFEDHGIGATPSRKRIFVCEPASAAEEDPCAERILSTLARRAFRRPVGAADLATPLRFYQEGKTQGGFEAGIELALRSLLVEPEFLFRIERDPAGIAPGTAYRVSDLELASRLSFFLWSSIPDDELLAAAERGTLRQLEVLERQVTRMLADPRSEALATNFADQWLHLRNLDTAHPDPRVFPDFDDNLRQAMRRETQLLFEAIVTDDRSVVELLTADYSFLNERLAKHYGVPHVYGSRFRRVAFPADSLRGGLLGQGSILTVTSYANRTSPVLRGKWVLENILGSPVPPPPPNVPALEEQKDGAKGLSMRDRMAEHRANPNCSGCHNLMDPVGFATENFDAIGRYRTRDESGAEIDATGSLPDGTEFVGVAELRQAVLDRPELFVSLLAEKLLTFALGRGLEHYDAPAVRSVVRHAREDDYRFSSVIAGIVESTPFQMRRSE